MLKILMLCSGGMSTSILIKKVKGVAATRGDEVKVAAFETSPAPNRAVAWDVCLLGPKMRYKLKGVLNAPLEIIDMKHCGMADGEVVYEQAQRIAGRK